MLTPIVGMVRKDLQIFLSDRRAVLMAFVVPIAIASFFGSIFSGGGSTEAARIPIAVVDHDGSGISRAIVAHASTDRNFVVTTPAEADARDQVRKGRITVAVIIPAGFGQAAGPAFFGGGARPQLALLYDPSHGMEMAMVRGILTQHVMEAVSGELFGGASGRDLVDTTLGTLDRTNMSEEQKRLMRTLLASVQGLYNQTAKPGQPPIGAPGMTMPYTVSEEAVTARSNVQYNGYAHAFAGMGIQFLLFAATNLGVEVLLERQRGLWRRLRSAPVSRLALLAGKTVSGTIIALMTLWVSFGFAMAVFGVRIQGSAAGFVAVSIACALMAATFGLLVAALGGTPAATRGVTALAVLMMVMLGGAWVPTFVFPSWLQRLTVVVPARWAVDGLDAMTWRGIGLSGAVMPTLVLLAFAAAFGAVAVLRFRWEEA